MSTSLVSLASLVAAFNPVTPQLRVAALIVRGTQLLLVEHHKRGQRYWVLPGGRLEGNETLDAALRRELQEELRLEARVGRLVIVCESLVPDRHVVNLIFQAEIGESDEPQLDARGAVLAGWQWGPVDQLAHLAHQAVRVAGVPYRLLHRVTSSVVECATLAPAANSRPRRSARSCNIRTSLAA